MRIRASLRVLLVGVAASAQAQQPSTAAASPDVIVQRFVDAANARDAGAMAALVAPDAIFARFPSGQVIVQSRDSIRAFYTRSLTPLPKEFHITVQPRTVEGQIVIDQEHFTGSPGGRTQATWIYFVRDGLIQKAWAVDAKPMP